MARHTRLAQLYGMTDCSYCHIFIILYKIKIQIHSTLYKLVQLCYNLLYGQLAIGKTHTNTFSHTYDTVTTKVGGDVHQHDS